MLYFLKHRWRTLFKRKKKTNLINLKEEGSFAVMVSVVWPLRMFFFIWTQKNTATPRSCYSVTVVFIFLFFFFSTCTDYIHAYILLFSRYFAKPSAQLKDSSLDVKFDISAAIRSHGWCSVTLKCLKHRHWRSTENTLTTITGSVTPLSPVFFSFYEASMPA